MLSKELEILKQIEELYHGDISEDEFLRACQGQEKKIEAWRKAFAEYPLFEVSKAINHFYVKKSSKTRPNIAQLTAILEESDAQKIVREKSTGEEVEPTFGIKFMEIDCANGDMHWLVPDYLEVERLIRADKWGFVQNIYHPTYEEFQRCMEYWSEEKLGRKYRFCSANDIAMMPQEERNKLYSRCKSITDNFFKGLN